MPTYLLHLAFRSPLLVALLLTSSGSLSAQELSVAPLPPPASLEPEKAAVNPASLDPFPSALGDATFVSGLPLPASPGSMAVVASAPMVERPKEFAQHPFWDRENRLLFIAVGALAAADFCTTRANLASGGRELNPVTRVFSGSTPGLATNFALETASTIGISFMFHKTGHHKLERMTSFVNIGTSAGAVAYGLTHR
jgi:hypothetical protein